MECLRPVLSALIACLGDSDGHVRQTTVHILETLGPVAAPAVPALIGSLEDPNQFVRWAAARALGKIGAPAAEAMPVLARLLLDRDPDLAVAAAAVVFALAGQGGSAPATGPANQALGIEGGYDYSFVPGTGHLLQIEKPDGCVRLTLEFPGKHGLA